MPPDERQQLAASRIAEVADAIKQAEELAVILRSAEQRATELQGGGILLESFEPKWPGHHPPIVEALKRITEARGPAEEPSTPYTRSRSAW